MTNHEAANPEFYPPTKSFKILEPLPGVLGLSDKRRGDKQSKRAAAKRSCISKHLLATSTVSMRTRTGNCASLLTVLGLTGQLTVYALGELLASQLVSCGGFKLRIF